MQTETNSLAPGRPETARAPSAPLLAGALAGLLAATALGCGSKDEASQDTDAGTYDYVVSTDEKTFAELTKLCDARGGYLQTTATCAGNNACKGFSYLDGTLNEHSCRGMNWCGPGASCVLLPADSGLSGKQVYVDKGCASTCHAQFDPTYDESVFQLYVQPTDVPLDEAKQRFLTGDVKRLHAVVAFGVTGITPSGVSFTNMPPYHEKLSRAEIERVVDYVRTLTVAPKTIAWISEPDAEDGGTAKDASPDGATSGDGG